MTPMNKKELEKTLNQMDALELVFKDPKALYEKLRKGIKAEFEASGLDKYDTDTHTLYYGPAKTVLDLDKLKTEHPEVYKACLVERHDFKISKMASAAKVAKAAETVAKAKRSKVAGG